MREPEIIKLINSKEPVNIKGINYDIVKVKTGHCDGCEFIDMKVCPDIARHICCTGGNILVKKDNNK